MVAQQRGRCQRRLAVEKVWVSVYAYEEGIDTLVDDVVPIFQDRGLFHREYEGAVLREYSGAPRP